MIATADAERQRSSLIRQHCLWSITTALADRAEKIERQRELAMSADRT
jgi:hypothetical protein